MQIWFLIKNTQDFYLENADMDFFIKKKGRFL